MTYSLNGVPLHNPARGWIFRSSSRPLADLENELSSVSRQGRHGILSPEPGLVGAPTIMLVVQVPRSQRQTLEAFVRKGGVLTSTYDAGEMTVELVSISPTGYAAAERIVDLAITFRIPEAAARGPIVTSNALALGTASVAVTGLFAGLGVEVQDAIVRVKGAATGLQVTDSSGAWFTFADPILATEWLRFDAATGRAWKTTTDVWTGGTEVSGAVDFGGPRGVFEISPYWGADPATRDGRLTVATGTRSGASIQVRGRAAFLV